MKRELHEGTVTTQKGFYIGDPCYALPDTIYQDVWGENGWDSGEIYVPNFGMCFAVDSTAYGDGCYRGSDGNVYPVDAGVLSIVPVEMMDKDVRGLGRIVECEGEARFSFEDGVFEIELPTGEEITIDTRGDEADDDDEYLIPDEERNEEDEDYE